MNNNVLRIKIQQRLNKLGSFDYDNLECWQIAEAVNKAQLQFARNQIHGNNQHQEADGSSKVNIDDLQILAIDKSMTATKHKIYYETALIPDDYLKYIKISCKAKSECCDPRPIVVYVHDRADEDNLLIDSFKSPSIEWGETFATISSNRFRIYTNDLFTISDIVLTYYKKPIDVSFDNCIDLKTGTLSQNVESIFKDDIMELIIDQACSILAGDIEANNQIIRNSQNAVINN